MYRMLSLLVVVSLFMGMSVGASEAKGHHNHPSASIDTHCMFPSYARRHPDKCPMMPVRGSQSGN